MSSCKEDQEEEKEVLLSIYESDDCFKCIDDQTYQYRIGEAGDFKSFLLEIKWGETYPGDLPTVNLGLFYNKHIRTSLQKTLETKLLSEGEDLLGCAMTYTLFEYAKENAEDLMVEQNEESISQEKQNEEKKNEKKSEPIQQVAKVKEKKVQLTKAQKRRITERTDFKGERARGWNWVDIVKHLSKTGGGDS